jgi:DedD protein
MRLPFLRPKPSAAKQRAGARTAAADADPASVEAARTRARRRLAGAVVLLVIGVVGFPILFETQPRPLPVDTPIELPAREVPMPSAAPGAKPAPRPLPVLPVETEPAPMPAAESASATASAASVAPPLQTPSSPPATPATPAPAAVAEVKPAASVPAPTPNAAAADDGRRARALLDGGAASAAPGGARWVVQVGAYTDAAKLREARAKVEKLELKTYTQEVNSDAGKRTRVRVGPFASRDEADAVAARVRKAGLPTAILAL